MVEGDECKLFSAKYSRGHPPVAKDIWVVGLIERDRDDTGKRRCAFILTDRRRASVLVPFIEKWVEKGSILITDKLKGYASSLKNVVFHDTVNHKTEFAHEGNVDGLELSINTNHIGCEWVEVLKLMRRNRLDTYEDKLKRDLRAGVPCWL